ncbi:MAG TPA: TGS domain-containing protein [Sedimentisphaerales bacterium]|nr:TGS domain-containing protein [Sedimentisphaerales bacterium]HRS12803.1 TGS domain-containing protein [Sedimentisphaerales bacterium]
MPANLTPDYFKAEQWYRSASTNEEKILALEQMLAVMPKHKGTEHLQADLKRKLSQLKDASAQQKKAGKHADIFHVPRSGAGQVVLLGTPNSGKSAILAALTHAKVTVADFPFATHAPVPGMVRYEDVQIQLVDMPPITADYAAPGQVGTYRNSDLIAIVVDLSQDVEEQLLILLDFLESRSLLLDEKTPATDGHGNALGRKAFCLCTKADIATDGAFELAKKSCAKPLEFVKISAQTGEGLDAFPRFLFEALGIIRVYAKPPGKPADMNEPFTLPAGSTVQDLARTIHRELAEKLKSARCWGTGVHDGQNVHLTHVLHDKDIVELHFG